MAPIIKETFTASFLWKAIWKSNPLPGALSSATLCAVLIDYLSHLSRKSWISVACAETEMSQLIIC